MCLLKCSRTVRRCQKDYFPRVNNFNSLYNRDHDGIRRDGTVDPHLVNIIFLIGHCSAIDPLPLAIASVVFYHHRVSNHCQPFAVGLQKLENDWDPGRIPGLHGKRLTTRLWQMIRPYPNDLTSQGG